jgi:hypothetical protein
MVQPPQLRTVGRVPSYVVVWRVLLGIYVAAALVALVIVNADQSNAPVAAGMMAAASLALGWGTASGWGAVVTWFLIPLALPFGQANQSAAGGGTDAIVVLALVSALVSTALILLAGGARVLYDRHRPSLLAARPQSAERKRVPRGAAAPPPPMADMRQMDEHNSSTEKIGAP